MVAEFDLFRTRVGPTFERYVAPPVAHRVSDRLVYHIITTDSCLGKAR